MKKILVIASALLAAAVVFVAIAVSGTGPDATEAEDVPKSAVRRAEEKGRKTKGAAANERKARLGRRTFRKGARGAAARGVAKADRPAAAAFSEEDDLTPKQQVVMKELQEALDANDLKNVRKTLERLSEAEMKTVGGKEVPDCMRARAVEALGWFGKDAALDLIGYIGDPNPDIAQDALSQFELALEDGEMSDAERSAIVKAAMQAITDPDVVETLLSQLNNMRNSVKYDTMIDIRDNGTKQARAGLEAELEFYADGELTGLNDLEKAKIENPDEEGDEETYGGSKEESADKKVETDNIGQNG